MIVDNPPSPPVEPPPVGAPDAGVIEDARQRQRRQRASGALAVLLVAVVVGLVAYAAHAGGDARAAAVPAPGVATGSLRALPSSHYQFWLTPTLFPNGLALMDVSSQFDGGSAGCAGGCSGYVGPGAPIGVIEEAGSTSPGVVDAPLPRNVSPDIVLFVAPNVAAVRVGRLGTVGAQSTRGLPPGDRIVAFRVPQSANAKSFPNGPHVELTALDRNGRPIPASTVAARLRSEPRHNWTTHGGACSVTTTLPGLTDQAPFASTSIEPQSASVPALFLSCLDAKFALGSSKFNVAILLNAHHPGARPAPLWNSTPVPGHPGIVKIAPPPQFPAGQDTSAPLYARRDGSAWLIVQARPGFAPNPSSAQRIQVLDSLHISRLDLTHS